MDLLFGFLATALIIAPIVGIVLTLGQRARLRALEDEVAELRRLLGGEARADAPVTPPRPADRHEVAEPGHAAAGDEPPATPEPPRRDAAALESFLGGRVALVVGVIAVLFAVGFFLKVAFERGWFPPEARVVASALAGVAALVVGDRLRARGLTAFGHAIMGGGLGALFLAVFYAVAGHGLLSRPVGFGLTAAVTLLGAVLAVRRDAPLLAWLGFVGAFLGPGLLGLDDTPEPLTAWLALVDVGLAWVLVRRAWPGLDALAVVATCEYFGTWVAEQAVDEQRVVAGLCLAALTLAQLVVTLAPAIVARRPASPLSLAMALVASAFAAFAGHELLADHARTALGLGLVAVGALHAVAALLAARRRPDEPVAPGRVATGEVLACFALAAVATSVPYLWEGRGMPVAWAAVGGAAIAAGARRDAAWFAGLGAAALALGFVGAQAEGWSFVEDASWVVDAGFVTSITPAVAAGLAAWAIGAWRPRWEPLAGVLRVVAAASAAHVLAHEAYTQLAEPDATRRVVQFAQGTSALVAAGFALVVALVGRRTGGAAGTAAAAAVLVALVYFALSLTHGPIVATPSFVNGHVGSSLAMIAGLAVVSATSRGAQRVLVGAAALVSWLTLASLELVEWAEVVPVGELSREALRFRAQVWMSVVWGTTGAVAVSLGFALDREGLRWSGLAVLAATVVKVFLFDLPRLDEASRIGSFLALGLVLVGASFLYQRTRERASTSSESPR